MKNLSIILAALLFISFLFSSCKVKEVNLQSEKEKLLNTDKEFAAYSKEHGAAEAFRKFLSDDALQFAAGGNIVIGNETVYNNMKKGDDGYDLLWQPEFAEVSKSGDFGWTWGYYDLHIKENGKTSYGKYLNVWKKNERDEWKVVADIGNPGPDKENR